jgi:hypothetical protein
MWPTWPVSVARHCSCGSDSPFLPSPWVIVAPATGLSLGAAATHCPTCIVLESGIRHAESRAMRRADPCCPGSPHSRRVFARVHTYHMHVSLCMSRIYPYGRARYASLGPGATTLPCVVPTAAGDCRAGVGRAIRAAANPTLPRATLPSPARRPGCALPWPSVLRRGLAITVALELERVCLDQATRLCAVHEHRCEPQSGHGRPLSTSGWTNEASRFTLHPAIT